MTITVLLKNVFDKLCMQNPNINICTYDLRWLTLYHVYHICKVTH